jgi:hypothetical protein
VTVDSYRWKAYDSTVCKSNVPVRSEIEPPPGGYSYLRGWVNLKIVILQSANHFKQLYDLLVSLENTFSMPPLPMIDLSNPVATPISFADFAPDAVEPLQDTSTRVLEMIERSATEVSLVRTTDRVRHFKAYLQSCGLNLKLNDSRIEHELRTLREALDDDLEERTVFFPSEEKLKFVTEMGRKYNFKLIYENLPDAHYQVVQAQYCYMADNDSACVYHAMGAAEYGLRALAKRVRLRKSLHATWGLMIKHLRPKIDGLQKTVRTIKRNGQLDFYNQLLDQCGFFNEHWRKPVAHLPPRYNAAEALNALSRSAEFLKVLAENGMKLPRELPNP